jgi:hypothetical protein
MQNKKWSRERDITIYILQGTNHNFLGVGNDIS